MIGIDRSRVKPPDALVQKGPTERDNVIAPKARSAPPTLKSGDFKSSIYGSKAVKKRLWEMQDGKCCFCEKWVEVSFTTVEHFRPKTSARDDAGKSRMGYWWLGFEFENLYLCCSNCNTPKSDYFPLAPGSMPLSEGVLASASNPPEAALVLDPGADDPEKHLDWVFVPGKGFVPAGRDERGKATVGATKLDQRDELIRLRGRYYRKFIVPVIASFKKAQQDNDPVRLAEAQQDAQVLAERDSEYAGMARAILRGEGLL